MMIGLHVRRKLAVTAVAHFRALNTAGYIGRIAVRVGGFRCAHTQPWSASAHVGVRKRSVPKLQQRANNMSNARVCVFCRSAHRTDAHC